MTDLERTEKWLNSLKIKYEKHDRGAYTISLEIKDESVISYGHDIDIDFTIEGNFKAFDINQIN